MTDPYHVRLVRSHLADCAGWGRCLAVTDRSRGVRAWLAAEAEWTRRGVLRWCGVVPAKGAG